MDALIDHLVASPEDSAWEQIQTEALPGDRSEPMLVSFLFATVLRCHAQRWRSPTLDGYKQVNAKSKSILRELIAKIESRTL